jgi:hypothetical protein
MFRGETTRENLTQRKQAPQAGLGYQRADVCYSNPIVRDFRAEIDDEQYSRFVNKKNLAVVKIDFEPDNPERKLQPEPHDPMNSSLQSKINKANGVIHAEPRDMSSSGDNAHFHIKKIPSKS